MWMPSLSHKALWARIATPKGAGLSPKSIEPFFLLLCWLILSGLYLEGYYMSQIWHLCLQSQGKDCWGHGIESMTSSVMGLEFWDNKVKVREIMRSALFYPKLKFGLTPITTWILTVATDWDLLRFSLFDFHTFPIHIERVKYCTKI